MSLRILPVLALLGVVAAIGWWLQQRLQEVTAPPAPATGPDLVMEDFRITGTDRAGDISYRLEGPRMVHYVEDDRTVIEAPRGQVLASDGAVWLIRGEKATVGPGGREAWFTGQVDIERPARSGHPPLRIRTRDLRLQLDRRLARTDAPARIELGRVDWIEGVGMRADFGHRRLDLLSRVRGEYAGTPRP